MRELIYKSPFDVTVTPEQKRKRSDTVLEKRLLGADEGCTCIDQDRIDKPILRSGRHQGVSAREVKFNMAGKTVVRRRQGERSNG